MKSSLTRFGQLVSVTAVLILAGAVGREVGGQGNQTLRIFDEACIAKAAGEIIDAAEKARSVSGDGRIGTGPQLALNEVYGRLVPGLATQVSVCSAHYRIGDSVGNCVPTSEKAFRLAVASSAVDLAKIEDAKGIGNCLISVAAPLALASDVSESRTLQREMAATLRAIRDRLPAPAPMAGGLSPGARQ